MRRRPIAASRFTGRRLVRAATLVAVAFGISAAPLAPGAEKRGAAVLADFEDGFPVHAERSPGFLPSDRDKAAMLSGGARGTGRFARFFFAPSEPSLFLQHSVRRKYLATGTSVYEPDVANALSFWVRLPKGSHLISERSQWKLGVWTYHWDPEDPNVGGRNNTSGPTDSMMHGYSNVWFLPGVEEKWFRVVLGTSAFRIQRDYYHFYAAQGVTAPLEFFPSLRQLQFKVLGEFDTIQTVDLDEIELTKRLRTASIEPAFVRQKVRCSPQDVAIPVTVRNPTEKARRYRIFVSSCLGAGRQVLNRAFFDSDSIDAPTAIQRALQAGGGIGVADLVSETGTRASGASGPAEIEIPAGGAWRGLLVHHIRTEMLGPSTPVRLQRYEWTARRDTLTTSVIVWDPREPSLPDMARVRGTASNTDDGRHDPPPGFPRQVRPPEGWRSEDVPLDQVGGYFVSEIVLE